MISDGARLHQKLPKNCFFGCNQPRLLVSSMCLLEIRMHFSNACKHQVSNSCFFFKQDKDDICRFEIHSWPGEIVQLFSFAWNDSKKFSRVYKYVLTCYLDQNNSGVRWSRHFFLNGLSCHVKYSHLTRCDAMDPPGAPSWGNGRTWVSISC